MSRFITWAARSDTGLVREINEDSAYAGQMLYAVADGMGGHAAGEVASAAVITSLSRHDEAVPAARLVDVLGSAVLEANATIRRLTEADPALRTMATTLTAMLWAGHTFALAHIGDSRAYLARGGRMHRLTEDHSLANLVAKAASAPNLAPVMTRYLDGRPDRSTDLGIREALPGDRYLLCSDGLSGVVPERAIREVLGTPAAPAAVTDQLVGLADRNGSPDNVTVIVIDVADAPVERAARPARFGAAA
jgi:protein phosphatase